MNEFLNSDEFDNDKNEDSAQDNDDCIYDEDFESDEEDSDEDATFDEFDEFDEDAVKSRHRMTRRKPKSSEIARLNAKKQKPKADKLGGVFWRVWNSLAKSGVIATAKGASIAVTSGILRHSYSRTAALLRAASIAVQGNMNKVSGQAVAAAGVVTSVAISGVFFGLRITISDSVLNADYRAFTLQVTYPTGGSNTLSFLVTPKKNSVELFVLLPSNAAGLGAIAPSTSATVSIAADAVRAGVSLSVETLNARDI